jgi:hypothetical protein
MALIALFALMARSTNRSTPTMAATGCQLQNVTAFRPSRAVQFTPVHASDAELGSDILSAHPLFRRRRTLISVGVDTS